MREEYHAISESFLLAKTLPTLHKLLKVIESNHNFMVCSLVCAVWGREYEYVKRNRSQWKRVGE